MMSFELFVIMATLALAILVFALLTSLLGWGFMAGCVVLSAIVLILVTIGGNRQ